MRSLAVLVLLLAAPVHAQPQPRAFYILARAPAPRVAPAELPASARVPHARVVSLRWALRSARDDRTAAARLDDQLTAAWSELRRALAAEPARSAAASLVYGEALFEGAARAYIAALDRDPEHDQPPDFGAAIRAWRDAERGTEEIAAFARYAQAHAWMEMSRPDEAVPLFERVASSSTALAAEARLRRGEIALDAGDASTAVVWYERAIDGARREHRSIVIYRLAWALFGAGRTSDCLAAIERLPSDASDQMRVDLAALEAHIAP